MLNEAIVKQLKEVFSQLEKEVELMLYSSDNEKQSELKEMLEGVSECSDKIKVSILDEKKPVPSFFINNTGISFRGIPGGHEFSSLILAILNSDGKGKFPDDFTINRIKNLKGPIDVKTYISLSCENCPEVVQALNLMAVIHEDFNHEMVDGAFTQDEIESLNIQGVPSVMKDDELISSGKKNMGELLNLLEKEFNIDKKENVDLGNYDVVIVGGGPAGVSSAIYTARKGLKTAIVADKVGGQVTETKGIENLISIPYTEGPELANNLLKHVNSYDIDLLEYRLVDSIENIEGDIKKIILNSQETITTRSIIISTGAKPRRLNIKGESAFVGKGIGFCTHCDGNFFKGKDVVIIGGGNSGVEAAIDLSGIVKSVIVLEYMDTLKADAVLIKKMEDLGNVKYITNVETKEFKGDSSLNKIIYQRRDTEEIIELPVDGVFIKMGYVANSDFIKDKVAVNKSGEIIVDKNNQTNIKGVFAAGDVTDISYKQIIISMGEGAKAGLSAFNYLTF